jgi:hypothetical protein
MYKNLQSSGTTPMSARLLTTLLASSWGLASAYILFYSLLVTHDARPCFAALIPLVVVWATLERKRWGRLALLGLSSTALGLFAAALGYSASVGNRWLPAENQNILGYLNVALHLYGYNSPGAALITLSLAATTGIWLRRPVVAAEFERGKRATMAVAQKAIAMTCVGCWGLTIAFLPNLNNPKAALLPKSSSIATHKAGGLKRTDASRPTRTKRAIRYEAPATNL